MKGKVRSFVEEHKTELTLGVGATIGFIVGFKFGGYIEDVALKRGFEKVLVAKPEVYPLMMDAVKEINHK